MKNIAKAQLGLNDDGFYVTPPPEKVERGYQTLREAEKEGLGDEEPEEATPEESSCRSH